MIRSFRDEQTEAIWRGRRSQRWPAVLQQRARRKLRMLDAATVLDDLRIPPANRLEKLRGDRRGSFSIRVNDQYRLCFRWRDGGAEDVELVDYHR